MQTNTTKNIEIIIILVRVYNIY